MPGSSLLILLLWSTLASAEPFPLPCVYAERGAAGEPTSHPACATRQGGHLVLAPTHLRRMSYATLGLAAVWIEGRWHYVQPGGASLPVVTLDNGPDPFAQGLVRTPRQGRIAYVDARLREVIGPRYDWGWPFAQGRALVCLGCRPIQDGEQIRMTGGRWGWIDRQGREVVPVRLTEAEARSRR